MDSSLPGTIALLLALAPAVATGAEIPFGPRQSIASATSFDANFLVAADVDRDGDNDLVWGGPTELGREISWLENTDARGSFGAAQIIATGELAGDHPFAVADLDGDGDVDVIESGLWHENAAGDGSTWVPHPLPVVGWSLVAVDLDLDGDVDLLRGQGTVDWYENDGASPPGWTGHLIGAGEALNGQVASSAADLDGDGDLDVASFGPGFGCGSGCGVQGVVKWFESDGASPPGWTEHVIIRPISGTPFPVLGRVYVADLNGDTAPDIITTSMSANTAGDAYWHASDGEPTPSFTRVAPLVDGIALPQDLDRDGDVDLIAGSGIAIAAWLDNVGLPPPIFDVREIELITPVAFTFATAYAPFDVDLDGDLDLVATFLDELVWYENLTEPVPALDGRALALLAALLLGATRLLPRLPRSDA